LAAIAAIQNWIEVSHHVACTWLGAQMFNFLAGEAAWRLLDHRGSAARQERIDGWLRPMQRVHDHAAECKQWSAVWKGSDSAIARFWS